MTPDEAFVAGVIEKLSEAQREAVLDHSAEWRRIAIGRGTGSGAARINAISGTGLFSRKIGRDSWVYRLTPLGLAVREQLLRMESGS